jgi:hypothetical protein
VPNSFLKKNLQELDELFFSKMMNDLWNPYSVLALLDDKGQPTEEFKKVIEKDMFGDMNTEEVLDFLKDQKKKCDSEVIKKIDKMNVDDFEKGETDVFNDLMPKKKNNA